MSQPIHEHSCRECGEPIRQPGLCDTCRDCPKCHGHGFVRTSVPTKHGGAGFVDMVCDCGAAVTLPVYRMEDAP